MNVTLTEWRRENACDAGQIEFVHNRLASLVGTGLYWEDARNLPRVISTHRSNGVVLPVYSLERADLGLRLVMRNNFYNWKLSVISERPIESDAFCYLFETEPPREPEYTGDDLADVYFEGFPDDLIFGYYGLSDRRRFSAQIANDYGMWVTVFETMRALGALPVLRATTKAEHRVELDQETAEWRRRDATRGDAVSVLYLHPACVTIGRAALDPHTVLGHLAAARTGRLGCLYGAATVGRCGKPVVAGTVRCETHPERFASTRRRP